MPIPFDIGDIRCLALAEIMDLIGVHPEITPLLYSVGETIISHHDSSKEFFIILRGRYEVRQPGTGVVLDRVECDIESFSIVGEMASLGCKVRTASVYATTECHALRLASEHLDTVINRFPILTKVICRQFAARLREADEALRGLRCVVQYGQVGECLNSRSKV